MQTWIFLVDTIFRLIARLDIKSPYLVKGVQLEGFKKIGDPSIYAEKYYQSGIDEISYQDVVASLYQRNNLNELVSKTASHVFVPICVGGGIRTVDDAMKLIRSGADKISINSAALFDENLIHQIAHFLGKQAVVVNIEAKRHGNEWRALYNTGRDFSDYSVINWIKRINKLPVGEILLTSVDEDGRKNGFDLPLLKVVREHTDISLLAHGGINSFENLRNVVNYGAQGAVLASALHYSSFNISDIKQKLSREGVRVRL